MKKVVLSFGRLNPITVGHEKLADKIKAVAKSEKATPQLYLSHSQDPKKNPLSYDEKYRLARKAFGPMVQKSRARTIIEVLKELDNKFDEVIVVVGSDRTREFDTLLSRYNNRDYSFDSIRVVSAGERDPDAEGVTGMSASKMRAAAAAGDFDLFKTGLPRALQRDAKSIYDTIRKNMNISESQLHEVLSIQQRRARKMLLRRIKGKIKRGRAIARRRMANPEKLKKRAAKRAREAIRKRVAGARGAKYSQLPLSARMQIDKQVAKRKSLIKRLATRMLPKVRKAERERLAKVRAAATKKESFEIADVITKLERHIISEKIRVNLKKKSEKYGVPYASLREAYFTFLRAYDANQTQLSEEQWSFQSLNSHLSNYVNEQIENALSYHAEGRIPLTENVFRMYSANYFKLFREARKLYREGLYTPIDASEKELLETDIGEFALKTEGERSEKVPLDCPMIEEDKDEKVELGKPKRGGPKKFYVHVKDPSTGNIKKVTFGDTSGLKVKLDDPAAAKSFAARHRCSTQTDRTSAAYWSCRLPRYAKQLGLSGGGSGFW